MAVISEGAARTDDEAILHRLGYAQVLYRELGGFSNFAISFTIISVITGCLGSYYIGFNNGGPVAITWGWLLVGAFCVLVAMAMGEIASSMPTAGALYFWASKLGGPAWGWFTGWFNLVGQIAVTASIQYSSALFGTALLSLWFPDAVGTDTGAVFITLTVIVALQLGLNLLGVGLLAKVNTISAWWHIVGVAVIVGVLIVVPENHQSAGFVFGEVINNSGFSDSAIWFVFGLGLLLSQYTISGYDASAHMSEETRQASRASALGMVMSVAVSVVFGFILLLAVTFAVPDVQGTVDAAGEAVIYIFTESLGETWTEFLLFITVIAMLFCGTASVTSASRMMFAFSRDRAVPFSAVWRKVATNRVPVNAVTAISVLAWVLMIPTLANGVVGYAVGTSIAVIGLYTAFALPIILRIKAGDKFEPGAWSLGRHYKWISTAAVAWVAIVCVIFLMPLSPNGIPGAEEFSWESVNYAPLTMGGAIILFGGWYLLSARKWFTGPVREASTEEELKNIEAQLDAETSGTATAEAAGAAATTEAVAVAEKGAESTDDEAGPPVEMAKSTDGKADSTVEKADDEAAGEAADEAKDEAAKDEAAKDEAAKDEAAKDEAAKDETADNTEADPADNTADNTAADDATPAAAAAPAADAEVEEEPAAEAPATEAPTADAEPTPEPEPAVEPEPASAAATDEDTGDDAGPGEPAATPAPAIAMADAESEPTSDGQADGAVVSPEVRAEITAELREELKAGLKAELKAELLEELRSEITATGRTTRSRTSSRTTAKTGSKSGSTRSTKTGSTANAEAGAEPEAPAK